MQATSLQGNASSVPVIYNFHVMVLLVTEMFPSELSQLSSKP